VLHSQDHPLKYGSLDYGTKFIKKSQELVSHRMESSDPAKYLRHSGQSLPKSYRGERPPQSQTSEQLLSSTQGLKASTLSKQSALGRKRSLQSSNAMVNVSSAVDESMNNQTQSSIRESMDQTHSNFGRFFQQMGGVPQRVVELL